MADSGPDRGAAGDVTTPLARQRESISSITWSLPTETFPTLETSATSSVRNSISGTDDAASIYSVSTSATSISRSASTSLSSYHDSDASPPQATRSGSGARPRSRRTRNSPANRSQPEVHAARVERSATLSTRKKDLSQSPKDSKTKKFPRSSLSSADSAPEQPGLTKMAFAEQQKWITVQQKTFTKW